MQFSRRPWIWYQAISLYRDDLRPLEHLVNYGRIVLMREALLTECYTLKFNLQERWK